MRAFQYRQSAAVTMFLTACTIGLSCECMCSCAQHVER